MNVQKVKSADGTEIAFERAGQGPSVILVGGAFNDRSARAAGRPLAELLAPRFAVFSYDRRGRGDSGDTAPWAIDREVEDLAALITAAGGSAFVYGMSSGGVLALAAALAQLPISKLAVYEPPLTLDASRAKAFDEVAQQLQDDAVAGRRSEAVELFLTKIIHMPAPAVAQMRRSPMWRGLESLAHTLSYDVRITTLGPSLMKRASSARAATLAILGDACRPWMRDAIHALADAVPGGRLRTLEGQTHDVDAKVLAAVLEEFFAG